MAFSEETVAEIVIRATDLASEKLRHVGEEAAVAGKEVEASSGRMSAATGIAAKGATLLAAGFVTAAAAIAAYSVHAASSFEEATLKIGNNTAMTNAQLDSMRKSVLKLADDSNVPINSIATGFEKAANAGFQGAQAYHIVEMSMRAAAETGGDMASTVDAVTGALKQFHLPASDAGQVLGTLMRAAAEGDVRLPDLVTNFSKVGSMAGAMNLPLSQTAAAFSTLTRFTHDASQSQTLLFGVLSHIENVTGPAQKEIDALAHASGVNLNDAFKKVRNGSIDLTTFMGTMREAVHKAGLTSGEAAAAFFQMFGGLRGGLGAVDLMIKGWKDYNKVAHDTANAGDLVNQQWKRTSETFDFSLGRIGNNLNHLAITFGSKLLPPLSQVTKRMADWTTQASQSGGAIDRLTTSLFGHDKTVKSVTTSYNALGDALPKVTTHIVHVNGVLDNLGDSFKRTKTSTGDGAAGLDHFGKSLDNLNGTLKLLTQPMDDHHQKTSALGQAWKDAGQLAEGLSLGALTLGQDLGHAGNFMDTARGQGIKFNDAVSQMNWTLVHTAQGGLTLIGTEAVKAGNSMLNMGVTSASAAGDVQKFGTRSDETARHILALKDGLDPAIASTKNIGSAAQSSAPHVTNLGTAAQNAHPHVTNLGNAAQQANPHLTAIAQEATKAASQISQAGQKIGQVSTQITAAIQHMGSAGTQAISQMGSRMSQAVSQASSHIVQQFHQMASQAESAVQQMTSRVMSAIHQMAAQLVSAGQQAGTGFASGLQAGFQAAVAAASSMRAQVMAILASMVGEAAGYGAAVGNAFAAGLASTAGAAAAAAASVLAAAKAALAFHSPNLLGDDPERWGRNAGNAFAKGLASTAAEAKAAAQAVVGGAMAILQGAGGTGAAASAAPSASGGAAQLTAAIAQLPQQLQSFMKPVLDGFIDQLRKAQSDYLQKVAKENQSYTDKLSNYLKSHAENLRHYLTDHAIQIKGANDAFLTRLLALSAQQTQALQDHNFKLANSLDAQMTKLESINGISTSKIKATLDEYLQHQNAQFQQHLAQLKKTHEEHLAGLKSAFQDHVSKIAAAMKAASGPGAIWDGLQKSISNFVDNSMKALELAILEHKGNLKQLTAEVVKAQAARAKLTQAEEDAALRVAKASNDFAGAQSAMQKKATDAANLVAQKMYDLAHGIHDGLPSLQALIDRAKKAAAAADAYATAQTAATAAITTQTGAIAALNTQTSLLTGGFARLILSMTALEGFFAALPGQMQSLFDGFRTGAAAIQAWNNLIPTAGFVIQAAAEQADKLGRAAAQAAQQVTVVARSFSQAQSDANAALTAAEEQYATDLMNHTGSLEADTAAILAAAGAAGSFASALAAAQAIATGATASAAAGTGGATSAGFNYTAPDPNAVVNIYGQGAWVPGSGGTGTPTSWVMSATPGIWVNTSQNSLMQQNGQWEYRDGTNGQFYIGGQPGPNYTLPSNLSATDVSGLFALSGSPSSPGGVGGGQSQAASGGGYYDSTGQASTPALSASDFYGAGAAPTSVVITGQGATDLNAIAANTQQQIQDLQHAVDVLTNQLKTAQDQLALERGAVSAMAGAGDTSSFLNPRDSLAYRS